LRWAEFCGLSCVYSSFWLDFPLVYFWFLYFLYEFYHLPVCFGSYFHYYSESFALNIFFCVCPEFRLILCLIQTNCFGCPTYGCVCFVCQGVCILLGLFVVARCVFLKSRLYTHAQHTDTSHTHTHTHSQTCCFN